MFCKVNLNLILFFLTLLIIPSYSSSSFDIELTVLVPAHQRECFHQILEAGKTIEVVYEVVTGGELDINYWFYSPTNRVLQSDFKKRDGHQTTKLEETGEYRFCLDNSFSRFSQKQVYFSLRPVNERGHSQMGEATEFLVTPTDQEELGDMQNKVQDIRETFERIYDNLETAQRYQSVFKNYEVHDRITIENNFDRINFWSVINLSLMITVTVIQVITIRSLFETKSAYGRFLRGKN
ncbi:unnamed protein product [Adineta steineri]|uniref:GOLD domain-containing protein n=1 Tax=Adineta steineri TaxID=433720 RepID=A0A818I332_9BILA|nr:unnamed protein product [Adineta steineri]CAF3519185.1 unnamed protein product [Adineta steineri]